MIMTFIGQPKERLLFPRRFFVLIKKKVMLPLASALLGFSMLVGCNNTIEEDPDTGQIEQDDNDVNEADDMRKDDEMDQHDGVDEDSLNEEDADQDEQR